MGIELQGSSSWAGGASQTRGRLAETGYTFAEVLVAGAVLGLVATSLYGMFAAGFCVIQSTRENLRATQIMAQKTEAIRLFTWNQICDTNNYLKPKFVEYYDPLGVAKDTGGVQYTGYVSSRIPPLGVLPEAYRTNLRTITVKVCWTNSNGAKPVAHSCEMQTRVARNGMQNYIWGNL